jgi:hypothetical protein
VGPKSGLRFRDICDERDLRFGIILPYESNRSKMPMSASTLSGPFGRGLPRSFAFPAADRILHRIVEAQPPCCASFIHGISGSPYAGWPWLRIHQRGFRFRSPCACCGRSSRIWFNRSSAMAGAMTKDEIVVIPPRLKAKASLTGLACLVMVFSPENTTLLLGVEPGVPCRHAHDRLEE